MEKQDLTSKYVDLKLGDVQVCEELSVREDQGDLASLAESIGITGGQPIHAPTVRKMAEDMMPPSYELFSGGRRYAAMLQKYGPDHIATFRVVEADDMDALTIAMLENIDRKDLTPIEEATGYNMMVAGGLKVKEIADRFGVSSSYISNRIRLLQLQPKVQQLISEEKIQPGHAEHGLLKLKEHPKEQMAVAKTLVKRGGDVHDAERMSSLALERIEDRKKIDSAFQKFLKGKNCPGCGNPLKPEQLEIAKYVYYGGAKLPPKNWLECRLKKKDGLRCMTTFDPETMKTVKQIGMQLERKTRKKLAEEKAPEKPKPVVPTFLTSRLRVPNFRKLVLEEVLKLKDFEEVRAKTKTGKYFYMMFHADGIVVEVAGVPDMEFEEVKLEDGSRTRVNLRYPDTRYKVGKALEAVRALEKGRLVEHLDRRKLKARKKRKKRKLRKKAKRKKRGRRKR